MTGKPVEIMPVAQGDGDGLGVTPGESRGVEGQPVRVVEATPATPPPAPPAPTDKKVIKLTPVPSPDVRSGPEFRQAKEDVLRFAHSQRIAIDATIARLNRDLGRVEVPAWVDLLRILEWAGDRSHYICPDPACKQAREAGHLPECRIDQMLRAQEVLLGRAIR
jgi:hypothetical protein